MTHIIRLKCTLPYPVIWIVDYLPYLSIQFSSVQFICVQLFATQCTAAHQASLFITNSQGLLRLTSMESMMLSNCPWTSTHQLPLSSTISQSLLKFVSIESVMLFNHLILCHLFLLLPSIFPSIRVFFKALYHRP